MPPGKRELARIERRFIATLTDACETAKGEIHGFAWLTHTADLNALTDTLRITWVFDTLADRQAAEANAKARIVELTAIALREADLELSLSARNLRLDSEEECQRSHAGDWRKRLARAN